MMKENGESTISQTGTLPVSTAKRSQKICLFVTADIVTIGGADLRFEAITELEYQQEQSPAHPEEQTASALDFIYLYNDLPVPHCRPAFHLKA